jgi:hypothetical protein
MMVNNSHHSQSGGYVKDVLDIATVQPDGATGWCGTVLAAQQAAVPVRKAPLTRLPELCEVGVLLWIQLMGKAAVIDAV